MTIPVNARWRAMLIAASVLLAACGDDATSPEDDFEVIEEVEFAASLDIDLDSMELLGSGIYVEDLVEGEGRQVVWGDFVDVKYTLWLRTGQEVDAAESFTFLMGNSEVISGFEQGVFLMRVGGVRKMIIPPILAYGAQGSSVAPPGAILVFQVEVLRAEPSAG